MRVEPLTELGNCNNSDEDFDDSYFPSVAELTSSTSWKVLAERGLSGRRTPQVVDKPVVYENSRSTNHGKPIIEESQGGHANLLCEPHYIPKTFFGGDARAHWRHGDIECYCCLYKRVKCQSSGRARGCCQQR